MTDEFVCPVRVLVAQSVCPECQKLDVRSNLQRQHKVCPEENGQERIARRQSPANQHLYEFQRGNPLVLVVESPLELVGRHRSPPIK